MTVYVAVDFHARQQTISYCDLADGEIHRLELRHQRRGVLGTYKKLEIPERAEGFDALYYVRIDPPGRFEVQEWADEV